VTWMVVSVSALLAVVAAAGVLRPLLSGRAPAVEPPDPLEEERTALLRALRDLERDRLSGSLEEETYRALRAETERRTAAVLRLVGAREGPGWAAGGAGGEEGAQAWRAVRRADDAPGARPPRPASRLAAALVATLLAAGGLSLALGSALRARAPGEPITGRVVGGGTDLAFFEQRVRDHPRDVAARLDLADRYLQAGDVRSATAQYLAALELDPRNPEALARLGFVLFTAGRPERGLEAVDRALEVDPDYPEALYYRGLILLRGLSRPSEAVAALRAYLDAAPFGARRDEVRGLLAEAERLAGGSSR
jgi:cytochrome c-type biogenesis protein CcmH